ncbi:MAG: YkgJ family cysteine cluster protein [Nanoarchaeota archaeon]|nr:YkgJ family cysteine cluster protein [Nanoarchaeota archaeon]
MDDFLKICQQCKAKCCKIGGTDFSEEEMKKVIDAGHPDFFVKIDEDHYETKCNDGVCPYLGKDEACTIHEVRPKLCRRWPVYSSVEAEERKNYLVDCPLARVLSQDIILNMVKINEDISSEFVSASIENSQLSEAEKDIVEERFSEFALSKI